MDDGRYEAGPGGLTEIGADRLAIRALIEDWVVYRDAADWERFRGVWHQPGRMNATWFQGSADEFIDVSRAAFQRGVRILHFLGGMSVDVRADRAVSQTKMTITQRGEIDGIDCEVVCTGRFYDFMLRSDRRWGMVERQPIYEQDRISALDPRAALDLDAELLGSFPYGYRHLAYLQSRAGYRVKTDMPGLVGPELQALLSRGAAWLAGDDRATSGLAT